MDPLKILPEEMWENVLDKLDNHTDLLSAYNTCQLWKSLVAKKQTEWMFQGVFPSIIKYLSTSDILNCRQVSKRWNNATDSYLESNQPCITAAGDLYQINFPSSQQRSLKVNINASAERQNKSVLEALKCFQKQFFSSSQVFTRVKNPFVSRSLELTISQPNWTVTEFFEKYGIHIWSLRLTIFQTRQENIVPQLNLFQFIWTILRLVPNLKKLILITQQNPTIFPEEEIKAQAVAVNQFLESNAVPCLPYLNNLQLNGNNYRVRKALELAYAPQLTKFVHNTPDWFAPENLRKLSELVWYYRSGGLTDSVRLLSKIKSPFLERLYVVIVGQNAVVESPAQHLFEELETFKNSLKYLSIYWRWFEPTFPSCLDLPFVEEISLQIGNCRNPTRINLSFLKTLKSLRKLKCYFWNPVYLKLSELLQNNKQRQRRQLMVDRVDFEYHLNFNGNGRGLYNSNIWRLVPSLETVEVHIVDWLGQTGVKNVKIFSRVEMGGNWKRTGFKCT